MSKHMMSKQRWLEANAHGKERLFDDLLALNAQFLAALEGLMKVVPTAVSHRDCDAYANCGLCAEIDSARVAIQEAKS